MTKSQLVSKLAEGGEMSRKQIDELLNGLVETITKSVKKGENVKIPGLGIFRLRKMKARMGRNPQTGEAIKIKASRRARVTPLKGFKDAVLAGKAPAKKAPAKKAVAKKTVAKKTVAKKAPAKKTVAKKTVAKKAPAKKATARR